MHSGFIRLPVGVSVWLNSVSVLWWTGGLSVVSPSALSSRWPLCYRKFQFDWIQLQLQCYLKATNMDTYARCKITPPHTHTAWTRQPHRCFDSSIQAALSVIATAQKTGKLWFHTASRDIFQVSTLLCFKDYRQTEAIKFSSEIIACLLMRTLRTGSLIWMCTKGIFVMYGWSTKALFFFKLLRTPMWADLSLLPADSNPPTKHMWGLVWVYSNALMVTVVRVCGCVWVRGRVCVKVSDRAVTRTQWHLAAGDDVLWDQNKMIKKERKKAVKKGAQVSHLISPLDRVSLDKGTSNANQVSFTWMIFCWLGWGLSN